jgi:NAD(P)-dependent dehydrogenase (short-subunit alcohol dehydrogenase family)
MAKCAPLDASNWNSQAKAFSAAVSDFGRIDYVYPIAGIGERVSIPNHANASALTGFEMPDLTVIDVDLTGVLYTISLAIQQFRRQDVGQNGIRGQSEFQHQGQ